MKQRKATNISIQPSHAILMPKKKSQKYTAYEGRRQTTVVFSQAQNDTQHSMDGDKTLTNTLADQNCDNLKKKKYGLKYLIKAQKIKNIVRNFVAKIKRNKINLPPIQYYPCSEIIEKNNINSFQGILISKKIQTLFTLIETFIFLSMIFFYGMSLPFYEEMQNQQLFIAVEGLVIAFLFIKIVKNIICVKQTESGKIIYLNQIFIEYFNNTLVLDVVCLVIAILAISVRWEQLKILRLLFFFQTKQFFRNIAELENCFIKNFQREQYWGVAKVFITNFIVAHIIGIIYLSIATGQSNWMSSMELDNKPWKQKYAYAYFWAMSTMLGFGNAIPSNPTQAFIISCIECFSCVFFAYILNHVGSLLANITRRNQDLELNFRTSRRLASQNSISQELFLKINNYIRQTDQIQKKITFKRDADFLSNLPEKLRKDFFKQSNKHTFSQIPFFRYLTQKTLMGLAQIITIKIAHPQQIIITRAQPFKFLMLRKGQIGYFLDTSFGIDKKVILNKTSVVDNQHVKLLSLEVFQEYEEMKYFMQSIAFSILYELQLQDVKRVIKNSNFDYEGFCMSKDRAKTIIDEFQVIQCQFCSTNHLKIKCPRLHYIPIKRQLYFKYIFDCRHNRNMRVLYKRKKQIQLEKPLLVYKTEFSSIESMIVSNNKLKDSIYYRNRTLQFNVKQNDEEFIREQNILKRIYQSDSIIEDNQSQRKQTKLLKKHQNLIKQLLEEARMRQKLEIEKKQFWDLECDNLFDYKFYFPEGNPCNLRVHLMCEVKKKQINIKSTITKKQATFSKKKMTSSILKKNY